jgi:hypothetical protein
LSGSSPLTCLAWEALPVVYATASIALGITWPHKPYHYVKVGLPSGGRNVLRDTKCITTMFIILTLRTDCVPVLSPSNMPVVTTYECHDANLLWSFAYQIGVVLTILLTIITSICKFTKKQTFVSSFQALCLFVRADGVGVRDMCSTWHVQYVTCQVLTAICKDPLGNKPLCKNMETR